MWVSRHKIFGHLFLQLLLLPVCILRSTIADPGDPQQPPVRMPTDIGISRSTSTSSPKMVTGRHVLKIEGYSRTKDLPAGKPIKSSIFTVGGHSWYMRYFPGGCACHWRDNDYVAVDLNLHQPAATGEVLIRFKVCLLDHASGKAYWPVPSIQQEGLGIRTFTHKKDSYCIHTFVRKASLSCYYAKDDNFKIRCDVTVIKDIDAEDTTVGPVALPPPDLHCHLGNLLDNQVGGDVTFKVDGKVFTAHRYVLAARSSVFMAQLFGPMKEKTASHVYVNDMDARVFEAMLRFIYTDMLPADMVEDEETVMAQHLLLAADRYNMERLKLICEDMLGKQINTGIVATTLVLAEQHGCSGLKEACLKFLMSPGNLKTVMTSDGFQHLKKSCPTLVDELLAKVAP